MHPFQGLSLDKNNSLKTPIRDHSTYNQQRKNFLFRSSGFYAYLLKLLPEIFFLEEKVLEGLLYLVPEENDWFFIDCCLLE